MKRCTKCLKIKDGSDFCKNKRSSDGYASHCKECHRSYYSPHPWHVYLPGDSKKCGRCNETKQIEEFDTRGNGYHTYCRECRRKMSLEWKRRNDERIREYRRANRKKLRAGVRRWEEANRERYLEIKRNLNSQEKYKIYCRLRQNIRHRAVRAGDFTREDFINLVQQQDACHYCGMVFSEQVPPTIDHVIPLSRGGEHTKANIVLACQSCNSRKRDKLLDDLPVRS